MHNMLPCAQVSAGAVTALSSPHTWWLSPTLPASQAQPSPQQLAVTSAAASAPALLSVSSMTQDPLAAQVPAGSLVSLLISTPSTPAAVEIRLWAAPQIPPPEPCRLSAALLPSLSSGASQNSSALPPCDPPGQPGSDPPPWKLWQQLPDCQVQLGTSNGTGLQCQLPSQLAAGRYRAVAWSAAAGFYLGMPRLDVLPMVTALVPATGECCAWHGLQNADIRRCRDFLDREC